MKSIFILILFPVLTVGQTVYDKHDALIDKANDLRKNEQFEAAIAAYQDAFDLVIPNGGFYYFYAADCAFALMKDSLAESLMRRGFTEGGGTMGQLESHKGFDHYREHPVYLSVLDDYNALRREYFSHIENIDLYLEIQEMESRDQFARKISDYLTGRTDDDISAAMDGLNKAQTAKDTAAIKKYKALLFPEQDPMHKKISFELMHVIDSMNIHRLMEITEEYGWQEEAWLILWHQRGSYGQNNAVWNYFKPTINKEIEAGRVSRSFWDMYESQGIRLSK